jgi:uncharacterized Zn finger protein (UPF0148 family)
METTCKWHWYKEEACWCSECSCKLYLGTPEYEGYDFCPFCGKKLEITDTNSPYYTENLNEI